MADLAEKVEIEDARWLAEQDAPDPRLERLYSTKGRVGKVTGLRRDAQTLRWMGETKRRDLPAWIEDAWLNLSQLARKNGKEPILFLHTKLDGDECCLHVISREEHARLVTALKELELLQVEVEELKANRTGRDISLVEKDLETLRNGLQDLEETVSNTLRWLTR